MKKVVAIILLLGVILLIYTLITNLPLVMAVVMNPIGLIVMFVLCAGLIFSVYKLVKYLRS